MIPKGNQRGGGQQLATHLLNSFDNEYVEIASVRGAVADDLHGAFAEWRAQAGTTKCRKYLYSLSVNPDLAKYDLTRDQYLDFISRAEKKLGLEGQPRAVVFHTKNGRAHCHVVWSRIHPDKMKAVQLSHDRQKLRSTAQEFASAHGLELPEGMRKDRGKDRFKDRAKVENLDEKQQQERTGIPKAERIRDITFAWTNSDNGPAFVAALEAKGYTLARGERHDKPSYLVVDLYGEVHSLSRQIENVRAKDIKDRLKSHPLDTLPGVDAAQATARDQLRARMDAAQKEQAPTLEDRRAGLQVRQAQRRKDLDQLRDNLLARQGSEREGLKDMQHAENSGVVNARLQNQPKGLTAFLVRITGIQAFIEYRREKQDQRREKQHKEQTEALSRRHDHERQDIDRHYRALARRDTRENKSLSLALRREEFGHLTPARTIKPEFDRAAHGIDIHVSAGDGDSRSARKGQAARDFTAALAGKTPTTKVDLQAAFERAKAAKAPASEGTTGEKAQAAEIDPDKLQQARDKKAELERRQREQEQGRKDRGPGDRER